MKYLKIQNNGELDIRLVALMGGTTKANDLYKIGQFGTGLKYTLAYLYRNNIQFKIFSGTEEINTSTETEDINGTEFEIICINDKRTSITTQMGAKWTAWMILRELWCNALDEGGEDRRTISSSEDNRELFGEEGKTTFYIQLTAEIQAVLDDWKRYFIHHRQPISDDPTHALYTNEDNGKLRLYKHGVLIYENPEVESVFLYDIKKADINELREFRGAISYEIHEALMNPSEEAVAYFLKNINEKHYEGSELDYNWFTSFGKVWENVVGDSRIATIGDSSYYSGSGVTVDFSNVIELPKKVYAALVKDFTGLGAMSMSDDNTQFYETVENAMLDRIRQTIFMLQEAGYPFSDDTLIHVGIFRDPKKTAAINRKKKVIMISEAAKDLKERELINLLVENNEYLKTEQQDTKLFARHLIDMFTKAIIPEQVPAS